MPVRSVCLFLLSTLCTASDVHVTVTLTGAVGGQVVLPCKMTKTSLDAGRQSVHPARSVVWWRSTGKEKKRMKVISVSSSGISFTAISMKSRVVIQQRWMDQGDFSLHLKDVTEQDAGIYYGVAIYGNSKWKCNATLRTIKLTPDTPGLLPEKTPVNLTCSAVGPAQTLRSVLWFHRRVLVNSSSRISVSGSSLYIHSLALDDRGEWSCEQDGARTSVTLNVLGISGPSSISVYAAAGSSAELPCNVTEIPVESQLRTRWSRGRFLMGENQQVLLFTSVRPEDAGTYTCDITYRSQQMTRQVHLRVIQVLPPGPTFARVGSSLKLVCNVTGSFAGEQFEWTGPTDPTGHKKVLRGAVLNLPAVHTQDSGTWICSVCGMDRSLGKAEHWIYVHAPQTGSGDSLSSWHYILPLSLILVLGMVAIAVVAFRNRQRRMSHLEALTAVDSPSASQPKKISVCEGSIE